LRLNKNYMSIFNKLGERERSKNEIKNYPFGFVYKIISVVVVILMVILILVSYLIWKTHTNEKQIKNQQIERGIKE